MEKPIIKSTGSPAFDAAVVHDFKAAMAATAQASFVTKLDGRRLVSTPENRHRFWRWAAERLSHASATNGAVSPPIPGLIPCGDTYVPRTTVPGLLANLLCDGRISNADYLALSHEWLTASPQIPKATGTFYRAQHDAAVLLAEKAKKESAPEKVAVEAPPVKQQSLICRISETVNATHAEREKIVSNAVKKVQPLFEDRPVCGLPYGGIAISVQPGEDFRAMATRIHEVVPVIGFTVIDHA